VVGVVDGESYLTEYVYDSAGNKTQSIRYATRVSFTPGASIASTRPAANALDRATATTYTALNQVASETNFEGTLVQYTYDEVGNLTQTVRAANTADVRTLNAQYDKQGRLTAQLNGNASALLTGNLTQGQIDAIWAANAIHYAYDAAGRRTSTIDPERQQDPFLLRRRRPADPLDQRSGRSAGEPLQRARPAHPDNRLRHAPLRWHDGYALRRLGQCDAHQCRGRHRQRHARLDQELQLHPARAGGEHHRSPCLCHQPDLQRLRRDGEQLRNRSARV